MESEGIVSRLAHQVACATRRMGEERAKGLEVQMTPSIIRSLRMTLASIVQLGDPREVGAQGFVCLVDQAAEPSVRHLGRTLPVSGPYLRHLFGGAGVELAPGQVILLDAGIVRNVVEEALVAIGREEAEIRDQKMKLVAAHLASDALDPEDAFPAGQLPREAA